MTSTDSVSTFSNCINYIYMRINSMIHIHNELTPHSYHIKFVSHRGFTQHLFCVFNKHVMEGFTPFSTTLMYSPSKTMLPFIQKQYFIKQVSFYIKILVPYRVRVSALLSDTPLRLSTYSTNSAYTEQRSSFGTAHLLEYPVNQYCEKTHWSSSSSRINELLLLRATLFSMAICSFR